MVRHHCGACLPIGPWPERRKPGATCAFSSSKTTATPPTTLPEAFREVGHVADQAPDGEEGLALALDGHYDVLIVDRMLPKRDGLSVIGELRAKGVETPVLILSALGQVDDRVKGLRAGGDDYLPKPYSFSELLARVEVLARRRGGRGEETVYRVADLELDRLSHQRQARQGGDRSCSRASSACSNI